MVRYLALVLALAAGTIVPYGLTGDEFVECTTDADCEERNSHIDPEDSYGPCDRE